MVLKFLNAAESMPDFFKRDFVIVYVNGQRVQVSGLDAFQPLSTFLRYHLQQTGTKVVCAEGDCGACTIMAAFPERKDPQFFAMNSCIAPVYLMDGASIVTVEGLNEAAEVNEVQKQMINCHGSQCGFCTPGFIMAMTAMCENEKQITAQKVKNYTTGNLCRCTGYQPIVNAGLAIDLKKIKPLEKKYLTAQIRKDLKQVSQKAFELKTPRRVAYGPKTTNEVSKILKTKKAVRIVSSATDLGVQFNKEKIELEAVITLHHLPELFELKDSKGKIFVGAKVDLSHLQEFLRKKNPDFSRFLNIFASPQIRNVATLIGNIANASPIADTIPVLFCLEAEVQIESLGRKRKVPIEQFYKGYKQIDLKAGEWISGIWMARPKSDEKMFLYKVSQRRDLDISTVNAAFWMKKSKGQLKALRIAYGGVGPTTLRLKNTEKFLLQHNLNSQKMAQAHEVLQTEISPISDMRASENFRRKVSANLLKKFYLEQSGVE